MNHHLVFAFKFMAITTLYLFTRSRTPPANNNNSNPGKALAVLFVLENLKRFLVHNARLIRDAATQADLLDNDICLFRAFLQDSARNPDKDLELQELEEKIHQVVTEGEAVIAEFESRVKENREGGLLKRVVGGPVKMVGVAKEVRAVRAKVKEIYDQSRVFRRRRERVCG